MDRPKSTHSTLSHVTEKTEKSSSTHVTARATPATPAHKTWTAYTGPVLFTGKFSLGHNIPRFNPQEQHLLMIFFIQRAPKICVLSQIYCEKIEWPISIRTYIRFYKCFIC